MSKKFIFGERFYMTERTLSAGLPFNEMTKQLRELFNTSNVVCSTDPFALQWAKQQGIEVSMRTYQTFRGSSQPNNREPK